MTREEELHAAVAAARSDLEVAEAFVKENPADQEALALRTDAGARLLLATTKLKEFYPEREVTHTWTGRKGYGGTMGVLGLSPGKLASAAIVLGILGLSLFGAFKK